MWSERRLLVVPPPNFAMVDRGIYRSGFPNKHNFEFLKLLNLKTVVRVCSEKNEEFDTFCKQANITLIHLPMEGNKEPFVGMEWKQIGNVLAYIKDSNNHPLLVHCSKGKHRTGCVVACLRKLQQRSLTYIFEEYERFTGRGKAELLDLQFIDLFDQGLELVEARQGYKLDQPDQLR
ncbi:hypothetical protein AAMO2058_001214700 [Amorphochlora amoebiformis]|mmetsp:Transcript_27231/g.43224  ORF Transcript_27231/g.43224 Transcript_27231/m.43224 type:complete len:177 (-) Transcript_27231:49-579(-)